MSDAEDEGQETAVRGEPGQRDDPPPTADGGSPDDGDKHAGRRWLVIGLVVAGIAAAGLVGYVVGDNGRDDDVQAAEAQASQANQDAEQAEQALQQEQVQDEEAMGAIRQGFEDLASAVEQEGAQNEQAAQDAVSEATAKIQSALKQLAGGASENVDQALAELESKISDAVGSRSAQGAPSGG
jgi:hypothetical protein